MAPELSWEDFKETVDRLLFANTGKHLTDLELAVLQGSWDKLSYEQIADKLGFSVDYIHKDIGSKLWRKISNALGEKNALGEDEKVSKQNFRHPIARYRQLETTSIPVAASFLELPKYPDGPLGADSRFYLMRGSIEADCDRELVNPGGLVRIKSPCLTGKTSLLNRLVDRLQKQHQYRVVRLNFRRVDRVFFTDLDRLLRWFCKEIGRQLEINAPLDDYWDSDIGSKVSCTDFFERAILPNLTTNLVLAIDDIDTIFNYQSVAEDFLSLLRGWHEEVNFSPDWQRLRSIVAHSTDVYINLDLDRSPFNIGLPIKLPPLTPPQVNNLAKLYNVANLESHDIPRLTDYLGGHPYYIQIALYHLSQPHETLADLLATAATEQGIYRDRLSRLLADLTAHPELVDALKTIVNSQTPISISTIPWKQLCLLDSMGSISFIGDGVIPSCQLYRDFFRERLS
jgi:hypothetical protein